MAKAQWWPAIAGVPCSALLTSQPDHEQDRRGKQPMLMKNQACSRLLLLLHSRLGLGLVAVIHIMVPAFGTHS